MTKVCYPPETLDTVWENWSNTVRKFKSYLSYHRYPRDGKLGQEFEDWLRQHGGQVRQHDGKRYLEFDREDQAVLFVLRWG